MIYSKDDVKRMLDALLERIYLLVKDGSFFHDEYDSLREAVEKLKEEL